MVDDQQQDEDWEAQLGRRSSGPPPLRPGRRDISAALLGTRGAAVSFADVLRALESVEIPINKSRKNVKQSEDQVEHPPITPINHTASRQANATRFTLKICDPALVLEIVSVD